IMYTFRMIAYWYKQWSGDNATYFKSDRITSNFPGGYTSHYWGSDDDSYTHQIFQASLAFAILAWIVDIVAILLVVFSLVGLFSKLPCLPMNILTKIMPIVVFVLCFISMFIFVGLPSAKKRDCEKQFGDGNCNAGGDLSKLVGSRDGFHWGPIEGWACVVVSTAFALGATVVSLVAGNF
ncbi:hypothetical protein SAMD00019534_035090, partial [Acytostelium subglobosum LB1]|uniref:hypothetical protein n=1 Tax=Acytostelium subglobosum LB1 TaxID=1410327 RepID=UPI0006449F0F